VKNIIEIRVLHLLFLFLCRYTSFFFVFYKVAEEEEDDE
jgi:hypothetical protein